MFTQGQKVKIISMDGGDFMRQFIGTVAIYQDIAGTSGTTHRVDVDSGKSLFLRDDQLQAV